MVAQPSFLSGSYDREMAEAAPAVPAASRMLTEGEAYAVAASEVARETAALKTQVTALETEKADLANKLDVAIAATEAEKQAREKAESDLVDYQNAQEEKKEAAARATERVAKVREVAKHLGDDFFTSERSERWAAMKDDDFAAYVAELAEVAPKGDGEMNDPPRETAAVGKSVDTPKSGTDNLRALFPRMKVG